jgi:hypothetical protein
MSKLKQLQLNIAHLIDNIGDQEELVRVFLDVKTGGARAMMFNQNIKTIIDFKSIYGEKLSQAIDILHEANKNNLTTGENVLTTEECGK